MSVLDPQQDRRAFTDALRPPPGYVEPQPVQRVGQLDPAPGYEPRRLLDLELHIGSDHLARLVRAPPVRQQQHLAGHHGRRGPRARVVEPAVGEQRVQAHACHSREP